MVSVYFFDSEDIVKEYINITLTPEIIAEMTAWIAEAERGEPWVMVA